MTKLPFPGETPYPRQLTLWEPDQPVRAIVLIAHGMAEHIARYDRTAKKLAKEGYLVCGYNHLGHGKEAPVKGYFAQKDGWGKTVSDMKTVMDFLKQRTPGAPCMLLGHSMGSFLAREYVLRYPEDLDALVLSGTAYHPKDLCLSGLVLANSLCGLGFEKKPSKFLDRMAFSANNKTFFKPGASGFEWLSRDHKEVKKYVEDPLCGFVFTGGGFRDLFRGLLRLTDGARLKKISKSMPVYLMSGANDPVGEMGKGPQEVARRYINAGLSNVTVKLYEGARHELLNETNRDEVTDDLIAWMKQSLKSREAA